MEASGQVLTLAQPQVLVQEGQQGLIETGQEVPYILNQEGSSSREWKQAVLGLTVTPRVLAERQVELDLAVVQDSIGELLANGELALNTHRLRTKVRMDMGQTLVLGGALYEQQLRRLLHSPQWLSVPIFNHWFKQHKKQSQRFELLVFVTPKLIS
jgi:type II secretory pathway component HofQ